MTQHIFVRRSRKRFGIIENNNQRQIDSALDDCDLDSDHEIGFFRSSLCDDETEP